MGKLTNLNPATPLTDAAIPDSITRDAELIAALASKAPLLNEKLALLLTQMPTGNAWGKELPHGPLQNYSWDTTPFGAFFTHSFTGSNTIPSGQYYGCKFAIGSDVNYSGYFCQVLIERFSGEIYLQWVEDNAITKEARLVRTILF